MPAAERPARLRRAKRLGGRHTEGPSRDHGPRRRALLPRCRLTSAWLMVAPSGKTLGTIARRRPEGATHVASIPGRPLGRDYVADEAARLRLLYDLGCAFAAQRELDELIPLIIEKCRDVLEAEGVAVLILDPLREEFRFPYVADEDTDVAER